MANDISSSIAVYEQETPGADVVANSPYQIKEIIVETTDVGDTADYFSITLADYGITNVKYVEGFIHTVRYSVIIGEAPTTSVTTGVLTVTLGGSTASNQSRVYIIGGY